MFFLKKAEKGTFQEKFPYVKFGRGQEKLIVFPPLNDALFDVFHYDWYFPLYLKAFIPDYEIYVISRPRNMPVGYETSDMARDYGEMITEELGPAHILGVSIGGFIAQHYAHQFPNLVKNLVLAVTAHKMGEGGLLTARKWIPWSRKGLWQKLHEDMIDITYTGKTYFFHKAIAKCFNKQLFKNVCPAEDFIISGQAGMIHHTKDILSEIKAKTFIVGGTEDSLFPKELIQETAELLPHSELHLIEGAKHGAYEENHTQVNSKILTFLKS